MRIGLTGGIAAGKSTVARRLGELGAVVIDHDVLARQVVEPGRPALADIVAAFGPDVARDGVLDRAALAARVFGDDAARARLNAITHPRIAEAAYAAEHAAQMAGRRVVVHDIPLLVETGQGDDFDLVVTVAAPSAVRLARLREGRGLNAQQAQARLAAQATDAQRAAVADVVLDGAGDVEGLRAQVDALWREYVDGSA